MTNTFLLVILLLEVRVLHSLVLPIKLCFTIKLAPVLELVGLEVLLLYQIGTRSSLNTSSTCVLFSRLLFHIKSTNEIRDGKLLPLMLQQGSKVPPQRRKLSDDTSGNKLVR